MKRAVDDARRERLDLAARIPTLTLVGPRRRRAGHRDRRRQAALARRSGRVDPGERKIEASAGGRTEKASVQSARRSGARYRSISPRPPPIAPRPRRRAGAASPLRAFGFVGVAVGGAGLAAGAGLGIAAFAEKGSLDAPGVCATPTSCDASARSKVDTYNTLRTSSAIALYAGAGVAALGVVLIVAAPRRSDTAAAIVLGPGNARLEGHF